MFLEKRKICVAATALAMVLSIVSAPAAMASPPQTTTIVADASDFDVFQSGALGEETLSDFGVGDTFDNLGRRALVKFSLAGLGEIQSVRLYLTIEQSRKDQYPAGITDSEPPFTNPGLGDTVVKHIADYGTPSAAGYGAPSIGNDPGILISKNKKPVSVVVSIDVTLAVKQAIEAGDSFVAFRIQTDIETDLDSHNDVWFFASANNPIESTRPVIIVTFR